MMSGLIWEEREVDLKYALWSAHREEWEDREPGAWELMEAAFEGYEVPPIDPQELGDVVCARIRTAPRKEIRYGVVEIGEGSASVRFKAGWDSIADLVPEGVPEERFEEVRDAIWEWFLGDGMMDEDGDPLGALVEEEVTAGTFVELMVKIDDLEDRLLREERERSKALDEYLALLVADRYDDDDDGDTLS
jgi:hypothetical protein